MRAITFLAVLFTLIFLGGFANATVYTVTLDDYMTITDTPPPVVTTAPAQVPEPATLGLLIMGLGFVGFARRGRRAS